MLGDPKISLEKNRGNVKFDFCDKSWQGLDNLICGIMSSIQYTGLTHILVGVKFFFKYNSSIKYIEGRRKQAGADLGQDQQILN